MKTFPCALLLTLCLANHAQILQSVEYSTAGKPSSVLIAPDGQHLLVSEAAVPIAGRRASAVEVFSLKNGKLHSDHLVPMGADPAQGILLIPHTHIVAIGLSGNGVGFFSLDDAIAGKAEVHVVPQGEQSGSGYLSVSADGKYLYVANEYAHPPVGGVGTIGVIALNTTADGAVHPRVITQAPSGRTTPGVAVSTDASRVYAAAEVLGPVIAERISGAKNPDLRKDGCKQVGDRAMPSGGLYVWDTAKLAALNADSTMKEFRGALINATNAGCSPVRIALTTDGKRLYTTARGDNKVLEFDTAKLENEGVDALLRVIPTEGEAPVGLALFNQDKSLLVANSNRFNGGRGNAVVIDLATGKVTQTIKAGDFPRNITVSPDGHTLYLTNFNSNSLQVLTLQ